MIKTKELVELLKSKKISSFLMVPCSIFKPVSSWFLNNQCNLIFAPNEAHALGFASGVYLATGKPAVVFIQNSGLNNIANAQTSLNFLYKIPAVIFISWRGKPGKKDAPEHALMGKKTRRLLSDLEIPYEVLSNDKWMAQINHMVVKSVKERRIVALLVPDGLIEKELLLGDNLALPVGLSRPKTLGIFKNYFKDSAVYVSTCGYTSRDSFSVAPTDDFYMLGSMGHTFSVGAGVAFGLSKNKPKLTTVVFDGDGSCLMHLGSLALVGLKEIKKGNFIYVLLDNGIYESTGGQPTLSSGINFIKVAEGLGFPQSFSVLDSKSLSDVLKKIEPNSAAFVWVKISSNQSSGGPRVSDRYSCSQITNNFIKHLSENK